MSANANKRSTAGYMSNKPMYEAYCSPSDSMEPNGEGDGVKSNVTHFTTPRCGLVLDPVEDRLEVVRLHVTWPSRRA